MSANRTSWKPKEGKRFTRAIKVSLHDDEVTAINRHVGLEETPAEWAREAVRERMRREGIVPTSIRRAVNQYVEKELGRRAAILKRDGD